MNSFTTKALVALCFAFIIYECDAEEPKRSLSVIERKFGENYSRNLHIVTDFNENMNRSSEYFFQSDRVAAELNLAGEQLKKLRDLKDSVPKLTDLFKMSNVKTGRNLGKMTVAQAQEARVAMSRNWSLSQKAIDDEIRKALTAAQLKRLKQIERQFILVEFQKYRLGSVFELPEDVSLAMTEKLLKDDSEIDKNLSALKWDAYSSVMTKSIGLSKYTSLVGKRFEDDASKKIPYGLRQISKKRDRVADAAMTARRNAFIARQGGDGIQGDVAEGIVLPNVSNPPLHLFDFDNIITELKLTDEQLKTLQSLKKLYQPSNRILQGEGAIVATVRGTIKKTLSLNQQKRLRQIHRQEILLGGRSLQTAADFGVPEKKVEDLIAELKEVERRIEKEIKVALWIRYSKTITETLGSAAKFHTFVGEPFYVDAADVRRQGSKSNPRR